MNKYKVIQQYYDSGKVKAYIKEISKGDDLTPFKECKNYDKYVDCFKTCEEAEQFCKQTLEA